MSKHIMIKIEGNKENKVKGCYELMTNGTIKCFKNDKYKVPKYCLNLLKKKSINYRKVE
jgi:hypothetical protein